MAYNVRCNQIDPLLLSSLKGLQIQRDYKHLELLYLRHHHHLLLLFSFNSAKFMQAFNFDYFSIIVMVVTITVDHPIFVYFKFIKELLQHLLHLHPRLIQFLHCH
jgi:hypothetical protein